MTIRPFSVLIGSASCLFLVHAASAATIYVDFGRSDNQTVGNYNNVHGTGTALATPSLALIDSTGAATGITLTTDFSSGGSWAGIGADYTGVYPAAIMGQPSTALMDSLFIRDPASTTMTLSGLDAALVYEILIYGSRGNNGGANTEWTVTDNAGSTEIGFDVFNNTTEVASFTSLVPDGSGEIAILYTTTDDGSRPRGGTNFVQINVIPEPTSSVLALGAFGILFVRRRR